MKMLQKIGIIFVAIFFVTIFFTTVNAASDFTLETLDFNCVLKSDGSMDVTETWNVKINGETNTLFKEYNLGNTNFKMKNVTVKEKTASKEFEKIDTLMYHVTTDRYYAMNNDSGVFEIAWGVNKSSGEKTYEVSYTVENAVTVYNDCAELAWQFVGKEFEMPVKEITASVSLPTSVSDKDNFRAWAHGPLNGNVSLDLKTAKFDLTSRRKGDFFEVRLVSLETNMFPLATIKENKEAFSAILEIEQKLADEANAQRERARKEEQVIMTVYVVIMITISIIYIILIRKNSKKLKEIPEIKPTTKLKYYRDIPNEKEATPTSAAFLHYFGGFSYNGHMPKILSATMLDLALKKLITFEVDTTSKKEEVTVKIEEKETNLKESEKIILDLFKEIAKNKENKFTMKDFEKYAKSHPATFNVELEKISKKMRYEQEDLKNYDSKIKEIANKYKGIATGNIIAAFVLAIFIVVPIFAIIYAVKCFKLAKRYSGLTQKGVDEKEEWQALKKYMEDFSLLKEKEVPSLVVWEKYLVYATLFGISEKVLKQLKVKYSEFSNEEYLRDTTYLYLIANTSFGTSFVSSIESSMTKAYTSVVAASSDSSGGGYGGGFSSGGGSFGGGRRRRRTLNLNEHIW